MNQRYEHFDMLRGIAVLLICFGHLRAFVFEDYSSIVNPSLGLTIFYGITSVGNQAIVFLFVLSGYLVGGQAIRKIILAQWSLSHYIFKRISRLWIVLIPGLFITLILDSIGSHLGGNPGYEGLWNSFYSTGPSVERPTVHLFETFIGNATFLQTIFVGEFGSNLALWSLANQFWYYLLFPFILFAFVPGGKLIPRILALIIGMIIVWMLPFNIVLLGSVWVMGAIASIVWESKCEFFSTPSRYIAFGIIFILIVFAINLNHNNRGLNTDIMLGFCYALSLPVLAGLPSLGKFYRRIALELSEISFTLFVVHYPFIVMIVFTLIAPNQWSVNISSLALFFSLLALVMIFSGIIWWCFERHTNFIRISIQNLAKNLSLKIF
jgi:peptidoglycan/LPS O-acetylase OafA/YrhL